MVCFFSQQSAAVFGESSWEKLGSEFLALSPSVDAHNEAFVCLTRDFPTKSYLISAFRGWNQSEENVWYNL